MDPTKTPRELVTLVDRLCYVCPKAHYTPGCPFPRLAGLTPASRSALLTDLGRERTLQLFDLATDCTCALDPRRPAATEH